MSALEFGVLTQPENTETDPIAAKLLGKNGEASGLSEPQQKRLLESRSGGKTPASTTTTPTATATPKKSRKPKSTTGIWMIEKSLDKKNWVPALWMQTRALAQSQAESSNENAHGLHYRVTRYEPAR